MTDSSPKLRRDLQIWIAAVLAFFAFNVWRYADFLIDDAYISLRYSRNWLEGHGLVFNPSEVVEGYTNFLWTVLGALGLALGFDGMVGGRGFRYWRLLLCYGAWRIFAAALWVARRPRCRHRGFF